MLQCLRRSRAYVGVDGQKRLGEVTKGDHVAKYGGIELLGEQLRQRRVGLGAQQIGARGGGARVDLVHAAGAGEVDGSEWPFHHPWREGPAGSIVGREDELRRRELEGQEAEREFDGHATEGPHVDLGRPAESEDHLGRAVPAALQGRGRVSAMVGAEHERTTEPRRSGGTWGRWSGGGGTRTGGGHSRGTQWHSPASRTCGRRA